MSENRDNFGFAKPDAKPQKSAKQSAFERQKAEAEAKRKREAAETAAVYEDFVKSFDNDDNQSTASGDPRQGRGDARMQQMPARGGRPPFGAGAPPTGGPSRRHFGQSGMKSGPGSLGPAPGGFNKKRSFQDFSKQHSRDNVQPDDQRNRAPISTVAKVFDTSDDEEMKDTENRNEERAVAKPTLRLANLPPGTSPSTIKALMPSNLVVEQVRVLPTNSAALGTERKSVVAIVTMSLETPGNEMDAAVSLLQNRYMGHGHYLSIHRHLSSAVSNSTTFPNLSNTSSSQPFGAKPVEQPGANESGQPSQRFHRGFAPPTDYGPAHGVNRANLLQVPVKPPQDIKTLQLINSVIEGILEHGPEFEALLMSRPEVQREEKWAWLWDARSEGGIWLRWRLWEVVTGSRSKKTKGKYMPLFEGSNAWKTPDKPLPFEYVTTLEELVSDSDYNSSDDDEFDDEGHKEGNRGDEDEKTFLNPLEKAKLTHLLARLPVSISGLRKGDIARVTAFALMHSSKGADEVVEMITANVEKPLSLTRANPDRVMDGNDGRDDATSDIPDVSGSSLVGLYVVNDILSSSSTSGVRHAWRFRQLFETTLHQNKTFEKLGLLPEKLKWGRLRVEKWKRSIGLILNLWEGWCVFPSESQSQFASSFEKPLTSKAEEMVDEAADYVQKGRWKVVDAGITDNCEDDAAAATNGGSDVEGEPIEDDDIEGEPIDDDDIEGEPINDEDLLDEPMEEDGVPAETAREGSEVDDEPVAADLQTGKPDKGRQRMRAVDMFADSDSGGE